MRRIVSLTAALLVLAWSNGIEAARDGATLQPAPRTVGEVRKVDKEQGKVTIRHGPLRNLEMPAMTMIFRVRDPAMLDGLREGDKIQFVAERLDGAITVVELERAP